MKKLVTLFLIMMAITGLNAQPTRRLQEQQAQKEAEKNPTAVTLTDRARSQYTAQTSMPTELTWGATYIVNLISRRRKTQPFTTRRIL